MAWTRVNCSASKFETPIQRAPRVLVRSGIVPRRRAGPLRPVHLIQVDAVDLKPLKAPFDLTTDRVGMQVVDDRPRLVPDEAALREHIGAIACRDLREGTAHDRLGMPEAVRGRRVDPVEPPVYGVPDHRDGIRVGLRAPPEQPFAANGPGAEPYACDLKIRSSELSRFHRRIIPCGGSTRMDRGSWDPPHVRRPGAVMRPIGASRTRR
jgi:hypothetical protein